MRSRKVKNGPVGVFATAIHFWFSLCWVFWFDVAFICIFETEESVIIWIVDINKFFESNDCSFITLTDCILACSLWIFADNFIISCYFELKQGKITFLVSFWCKIIFPKSSQPSLYSSKDAAGREESNYI